MRVIRLRAWVLRVLCAWFVLVLALVVLIVLEPELPAPRSPRRHLPDNYWRHRAYHPTRYTRTGCIQPPGHRELRHSGFWQHVVDAADPVEGADEVTGPVTVFAAYWDARSDPLVRLFVHSELRVELRCLFWYYNTGDPLQVQASVPLLDEARTPLHVVSCAPSSTLPHEALAAVSVVTTDFTCGVPRNMLAVQGVPNKGSSTPAPLTDPRLPGTRVGVCVLWWRRGDAAARLVEWLHLLRYFGVHRVYLYLNNNAHENVLRVVEHFSWQKDERTTMLDVMPYASPPLSFTAPPEKRENKTSKTHSLNENFDEYYEDPTDSDSLEENTNIRSDDVLPYNECVQRALGERLSWLALLDLDELIVPIRDGTWDRLTYMESRRAKFLTDELADVLRFQRWWFPELLQLNLTSPAPLTDAGITQRQEWYAAGYPRRSSPAPFVPRGRVFEYAWSAPTPRSDVVVTGTLLRVSRVERVRRRDVVCVDAACRMHTVENRAARVQVYASRCGGAARGVCRALRRVAVRSEALARWRSARRDAARTLRLLRLSAHAHRDRDDE